MRWGEPSRAGLERKFAFLPLPLVTGGWAWLEWVEAKRIHPRAHGVCGDVFEFTKVPGSDVIAASPQSPPPPKPKR